MSYVALDSAPYGQNFTVLSSLKVVDCEVAVLASLPWVQPSITSSAAPRSISLGLGVGLLYSMGCFFELRRFAVSGLMRLAPAAVRSAGLVASTQSMPP